MSEKKTPQDRKSKKPTVKAVDGGKVITFPDLFEKVDGVVVMVGEKPKRLTVTVADESLDDFEFLDDMRALEEGNSTKLPAILRRVIGADFAIAMDALRNDQGRVPIGAGLEFLSDLMGALNPNS